ncbi:hypothetical protein RI367_005338 [Sorochytrium milnesiophthora]
MGRHQTLGRSHRAEDVLEQQQTFGWPDALRYRGSVIGRIWFPVLLMTLWNTLIFVVSTFAFKNGARSVSLASTFITIISLVLSLLLVFRTNTAYDRYWDGRKLWGTLMVACRNLSRIIWVGVDEVEPIDLVEKRAAMRLILAFFVATKNSLRCEYGLRGPDGKVREELAQLIPPKKQESLKRLEDERSMHSVVGCLEDNASGSPLRSPQSRRQRSPSPAGTSLAPPPSPNAAGSSSSVPHVTMVDLSGEVDEKPAGQLQLPDTSRLHRRMSTRSTRSTRSACSAVSRRSRHYGSFDGAGGDVVNLPIDISHLLSAYIVSQRKKEHIDVPQFGVMINTMSSMIDTLTNLERILTTPIPLAYNIHLKQAMYLYLLLLPFQVIGQIFTYYDTVYGGSGKAPNGLAALSILVTFLISFTFLGVESIGAEIENPFGEDQNDLPLEQFVADMRAELDTLMRKPPVHLADWELTAIATSPSTTDVPTPPTHVVLPSDNLVDVHPHVFVPVLKQPPIPTIVERPPSEMAPSPPRSPPLEAVEAVLPPTAIHASAATLTPASASELLPVAKQQ